MLSSHIFLIDHLQLSKSSTIFATMTEVTESLKNLRTVFNKYSEFGEKDYLTKSELTHLLCTEMELPAESKPEVEKYVDQDVSGDGVTFKEFVKYLVEIELMFCQE